MPKSKLYRVIWEIDIVATSPERAAKAALDIQRDVNSSALVFRVAEKMCEMEFDLWT